MALFEKRPLNPHRWYTADHLLIFQCALDSQPAHHIALGRRWTQLDTLHDSLYGVSGVLPLLYHRLQESGVESPLKDRLTGVYRRNWAGNQVLLSQIKQISVTLSKQNILHAFAGDLAILYQLYQARDTRPIWLIRLIVDDAQLSNASQVIQAQHSDRQFEAQKPPYLRHGRGFVGGKNPILVINNGLIEADDLSKWETTIINDLPLLNCSILLIRTVAHTVGRTPHVQQMVDILYMLNQLTPEEQEQVIGQLEEMGLGFPFWQIVIYLVDVLGMTQHQALADKLTHHVKPQFISYAKYWLHRVWQRFQ